MLLSITTTHSPATDLGFLLHKHPDRLQSVELAVGKAHIFYPEASEEKATACVLLDIDPVELVRSGKNWGKGAFALGQYVNDRPYVLSSMMSVALSKAFSSAMNGRCNNHPELVGTMMPLEATLDVVPAPNGGEALIRELFEPLGYELSINGYPLDRKFPEWGESKYYSVNISAVTTVQALLNHLYVLIPALDGDKHYFVSQDEIDVLLKKGEGWLKDHPKKTEIARRFLINLRGLANQAIARLVEDETVVEDDEEIAAVESTEINEVRMSLHMQRIHAVFDELVASGASSVADLGCGEGKLLQLLKKSSQFQRIVAMDVSYESLVRAKERLHWDEVSPRMKERMQFIHGSLTYTDSRLQGVQAAALVEVIEHLDEDRLGALENSLFSFMSPSTVIITTPNSEYNQVYDSMSPGAYRHTDHRFEWSREQFRSWCEGIKERYGYDYDVKPLGEVHEQFGAPSQMGVFRRGD